MPPISPCGMAVEWLRSCHRGAWRFYANNLDVITKGRYYFVADDTPFLPVPNDFTSCIWTAPDREPPILTGEVVNFKRTWTNGRLGVRQPPRVPIGNAAQFASGPLPYPFPEPDRTSVMGVDSRCWTNVGASFVGVDEICALESCCLQVAMARLIQLVYDVDPIRIESFFKTWIGPACTVTYFPLRGLAPAIAIAVHPDLAVVVCSGTDNFQQLALQAFMGLQPPTNLGTVSTLELWFLLSTGIIEALVRLGADATKPILLVGHSYGAAAVSLMAARMRSANADRDICLLTFGCPRLGDDRLTLLLRRVHAVHLCGIDDLVTVLPPSAQDLAAFLPMIGQQLLDFWVTWRKIENRYDLYADGTTVFNDSPVTLYNVLLPIITNALAHVQIPAISGHFIATYIQRLRLHCPEPCYPMTIQLWRILFGVGELVLTGSGPASGTLRLFGGPFTESVSLLLGGGPPPGAELLLGGGPPPGAELLLGGGPPPGAELLLGGGGGPPPEAVLLLESIATEPTPGLTCAAAGALPLDTETTVDIGAGETHWWLVQVDNTVEYHVTITVNSGFFATCNIWKGDCGSLTGVTSFIPMGTACGDATAGTEGDWKIEIPGPFAGGNYTITFAEGACP